VANPTAFIAVGDDLVTGQTHQSITAMTTAAATARGVARRRCRAPRDTPGTVTRRLLRGATNRPARSARYS
jgi:hypothetical protein